MRTDKEQIAFLEQEKATITESFNKAWRRSCDLVQQCDRLRTELDIVKGLLEIVSEDAVMSKAINAPWLLARVNATLDATSED